jgi:sugar phosphate isomerase/epimerase
LLELITNGRLKMFTSLSPGTIGIRGTSLPESIKLARDSGFQGLDFNMSEAANLATANGVGFVRDLFANAGIRPGSWGLPVNWRDDAVWEADLRELPRLAALGSELDATRVTTWMLPFSDERTYLANFAWHVARFRPIAAVLADHGCRFGIEFIGPRTLRAAHAHEFIYTMDGLMELARAIGTGNVGLLLDAYHLYTSGGQIADLERITARDIVLVHVNDAIAGVPRDEQLDLVRALPAETGVLEIGPFLRKLDQLGYDGPVTPEPFSKRLNELASSDHLAAAREAARSMRAAWEKAGLA